MHGNVWPMSELDPDHLRLSWLEFRWDKSHTKELSEGVIQSLKRMGFGSQLNVACLRRWVNVVIEIYRKNNISWKFIHRQYLKGELKSTKFFESETTSRVLDGHLDTHCHVSRSLKSPPVHFRQPEFSPVRHQESQSAWQATCLLLILLSSMS
jgi:hypothetical protein